MELGLQGGLGASPSPCWPSLLEGGGSWLLWDGLHNIHKWPLRTVPSESCFQHGGQQWAGGGRRGLALTLLLTTCVWNVQMFPLGLQLALTSPLPPTSRLRNGHLGHSSQLRRKPRLLSSCWVVACCGQPVERLLLQLWNRVGPNNWPS